jgi:hypothetical protein
MPAVAVVPVATVNLVDFLTVIPVGKAARVSRCPSGPLQHQLVHQVITLVAVVVVIGRGLLVRVESAAEEPVVLTG